MITIQGKGKTVYGPNIVTDGLVLYLDSFNIKSYPETGNTWYDLSGYNNHGTMTNFSGTSTGSTSGFNTITKSMMFDRHIGAADGSINNIVNFNSSDSLLDCLSQNGVSIELWVKITTPVCTAMAKMEGAWEIYYCNPLVHRTQGTGGSDGSSGILNTVYTNFHNIMSTHDGTNKKIFINGVNVYDQVNIVSNQSFSTLALGGYSNGNYAFVGAIPIFKLYNRALTDLEIVQNYNALKSRFK